MERPYTYTCKWRLLWDIAHQCLYLMENSNKCTCRMHAYAYLYMHMHLNKNG